MAILSVTTYLNQESLDIPVMIDVYVNEGRLK